MTTYDELRAPWHIHFDRDGTEDFGVILDTDGNEIVRSRFFWLPEGDDPTPVVLTALWVIKVAPLLLSALNAFVEMDELANECGEWKWENLTDEFARARMIIARAKGGLL
jgi:hypothetical protein